MDVGPIPPLHQTPLRGGGFDLLDLLIDLAEFWSQLVECRLRIRYGFLHCTNPLASPGGGHSDLRQSDDEKLEFPELVSGFQRSYPTSPSTMPKAEGRFDEALNMPRTTVTARLSA